MIALPEESCGRFLASRRAVRSKASVHLAPRLATRNALATRDPVARYYDRNTRRFLLLGRSGDRYAIHRELWGPGVRSAREAAGYVNRLVGDEVEAMLGSGGRAHPDSASGGVPTILDMGCGVGGTLFALAERFPAAVLLGVTNSRRQHALAGRLAKRVGVAGRCRIELADFQSMRLGLRADAVVGIESFVHADTPERFFATAASHLRGGGRLILVDDFLDREEPLLASEARLRVRRFREGWHARSVCTVAACASAAREVGLRLVDDRDLTSLVRPGARLRDTLVARVSPLLLALGFVRRWPLFANMIGGNALQTGLREGFIRYRMLVFEAAASEESAPHPHSLYPHTWHFTQPSS